MFHGFSWSIYENGGTKETRKIENGGTIHMSLSHEWKMRSHFKKTVEQYLGLPPLPVTVANEGLGWDPRS